MDEDKKANLSGLPQEPRRNTTQQPEEYIDKNGERKDEGDRPGRLPGDDNDNTRRQKGSQETS